MLLQLTKTCPNHKKNYVEGTCHRTFKCWLQNVTFVAQSMDIAVVRTQEIGCLLYIVLLSLAQGLFS